MSGDPLRTIGVLLIIWSALLIGFGFGVLVGAS